MVLIKPVISEKTLAEAANKRYAFKVRLLATKPEIRQAVEKTFGVKVKKVQTMVVPGKTYRSGKRWTFKKKADWKKAIVTIKPDKKIDLFETSESAK
jgi:large subunit ribosomal protein L23